MAASGRSRVGRCDVTCIRSIHLKASRAICRKLVFSPTILIEKSWHVIHLRLQSALVIGESEDPYRRSSISTIPPTQRIPNFQPSKRGPNLVRSFDVPPTLVRGSKLESAHEVPDFDFVGIPASKSSYA
ncbi:hypothetical protein AVEN_4388-1, partial [Araneus ventricosus]